MTFTQAGILICCAAVFAGPWYTVAGYSPVGNSISELAAQKTRNRSIMVGGFTALGLGIMTDGLLHFHATAVPFMTYGLCMLFAGLFGHKPIDVSVPYVEVVDKIHSILASLAGFSITIAFVWQGFFTELAWFRVVSFAMVLLCTGLPLLMLRIPRLQGLIQRIMFLSVFLWLWFYFPLLIN